MSKTHISNELSTQPYNHTSSCKHHDPPSNSYLLLKTERTSDMQMLFSLLYITYNKQTKTRNIYINTYQFLLFNKTLKLLYINIYNENHFFYLIFFSILWSRWVDDHAQKVLAKFC
jgi:hypothetical protein